MSFLPKVTRVIAGVCLAIVPAFLPVQAQTGAGTIRGTVQDASQAVVPGAKIRLTNQDTNVTQESTSSAAGIYYFGGLQPGRYQVSVEASGFKRWSGTLLLAVGQTAAVDVNLEVGSLANTVEVSGASPLINTETMGVADVKDFLRIHQLPLNGRDVTNLFNLTPGVEGGGPAPRVNGGKVGSTEILQDGISQVDRFGGGMTRVRPGLDTVQEFRIETSGSSAKYAHPATVLLVTKSGTNSLHGSVFETFRDNAGGLRARQRQDGNTPAKYIRNEFGASAGGPVFIPKLYNGKDKSFWFFSYEGMRLRQSYFDQDYVPTAQMWNGDFSQVVDNSGNHTHIYDPTTTNAQGLRMPFPGDIIPQSRISPFFGVMKSVTNTPTAATNPFQDYNLFTFYPLQQNNDTFTVKGDQKITDKDSLSGRFTRSRLHVAQFGGRYGSPIQGTANPYGTSRSDSWVYSVSVNYNRTFTPTLLNELLLAAHRNPNSQGTLADDFNWANQLGLPNPFGALGWPTIYAGNDPWGWDSDNRKDQNLTAYQLEDNATWIKGRHTVIFGGMIRHEDNNVRELQQSQGSHDFAADWTSQYDPVGDQAVSYTGVGLASMAVGLPTYLSNQYNRGFFYFQQWNVGLYAQDTWKATRRLTIDYGLRWEKWTPYHEKLNRLVNVDLTKYATQFQVITPGDHTMESLRGIPPAVLSSWANRGLTWATADQANFPSALLPANNHNLGPRVGVAFRLTDKTVLRAGYGLYYWTMPLSQILQGSRTNPPLNLRFTNPLASLDGTSTYAVRTAPTPNLYVGSAKVDTEGVVQLPVTAQSIMPWDANGWTDDRMHSWNFTIEREFLKNTVLRLAYIGSHGSNLEQRYNINSQEAQYNYVAATGQPVPGQRDQLRVNPNWNFSAANHTGYSNTNSFQGGVEHRYSNGLTLQWFYTFTRSLNTTDADGSTSGNGANIGNGAINDTGGAPAVPENINILGNPNLSYDQRLRLVYYNSTFIPAHHIRWNGVYDLPFGKGKHFGRNAGGLLNQIIGGWQVATIGDWRSGLWMGINPLANPAEFTFGDPTLNADQRLTMYYNGKPQRLWFKGDFDPTQATNVNLQSLEALVPVNRAQRAIHPVGDAFDNRIPQTLADGTTRLTPVTDVVSWNPRAFFKGPGAWNVDTSLFKNFPIRESMKVRFTADFFNVFNHPNDQNPNTATGLQDLSTQPNDPRIIQFSLRFEW